MNNSEIIAVKNIEQKIYTIRGKQVMIDENLADLYGIETKYLNRAVKRNPGRFPEVFMFQLTKDEFEDLKYQNGTLDPNDALRFQSGTLKTGRGQHRKYLPYVFTEQGVAMLSAVLKAEVYHLGASLKDLGKKWFAFSKMDKDSLIILEKLGI